MSTVFTNVCRLLQFEVNCFHQKNSSYIDFQNELLFFLCAYKILPLCCDSLAPDSAIFSCSRMCMCFCSLYLAADATFSSGCFVATTSSPFSLWFHSWWRRCVLKLGSACLPLFCFCSSVCIYYLVIACWPNKAHTIKESSIPKKRISRLCEISSLDRAVKPWHALLVIEKLLRRMTVFKKAWRQCWLLSYVDPCVTTQTTM